MQKKKTIRFKIIFLFSYVGFASPKSRRPSISLAKVWLSLIFIITPIPRFLWRRSFLFLLSPQPGQKNIRACLVNAFILPLLHEPRKTQAEPLLLTYKPNGRCISRTDRYICKRPIKCQYCTSGYCSSQAAYISHTSCGSNQTSG